MTYNIYEIEKLIDYAQIHAYLYDIQHNQNKAVMKNAQAWKEIGLELK